MDYFNQETERLTLRALTESDIPKWREFFNNNNRLHFLGLDLTKSKDLLAEEWIKFQLKRYQDDELGLLIAETKSSGEVIGMVGIIPRELNGALYDEIAYSIMPSHWGNGFATELAEQIKWFGERYKINDQFISIIHKDNHESLNVAKKLGMTEKEITTFRGMPVIIYSTQLV